MSFTEVLEELPHLTMEERHRLILRALELDDLPLSDEDTALVEARLTGHHANPNSSIPLQTLKDRLRDPRQL